MTDSDDELVKYGHVEAWSNELGIAVDVLRERLKEVEGITGRTYDDEVLVNGFYPEQDVLRVCRDLLDE